MPSERSFTFFNALPQHIQQNIWELSMREVLMSEPSVGSLNPWLMRYYEIPEPEDHPRNIPPPTSNNISQKSRLHCSSKYWQVHNIASVCCDAWNTFKGLDATVSGSRGATAGMFPLFNSTQTVVCFAGFYKGRPQEWYPEGVEAQDPLYYTSVACCDLIDEPPRTSRSLEKAYIYTMYFADPINIKRVVLIHSKHRAFKEGCCAWPTIQRLWPLKMQNLKEIYLIDEFMSLRDDSQPPPESRLKIEGYCATFFEVTEDDGNIWTPFPTALLAQATKFEKEFEERAEPGYPPPTIKILGCVPYYNFGVPGLASSGGQANGQQS